MTGQHAQAAATYWPGNGHSYEVVLAPGAISWTQADAAAHAAGGYLATLTSDAENTFVFNLAADPQYWRLDTTHNFGIGPYLGGLQTNKTSEPGGNWAWETGEAWSYTKWAPDEPNNSYGAEDYLQFFGYGALMTPQWNDCANDNSVFVPGNYAISYIVEFVPEPSTTTLVCLAGGAALVRRLHRRRRFSTQIVS